jgi:nitrogen fixation/metabolism regulation signal transduction histidine kinase
VKLRTKYLIFFFAIHLIFIGLSIAIYRYNKVLFVISELAIFISILLFLNFYRAIFRPFRLLNAGIESISDKDFSTKILPIGQSELDQLIDVFNRMIDQLRLERTISIEKNFFLEKLIDASPAALIILDKSNKISTVNPATFNILKIDADKPLPTTLKELPEPWNTELLLLKDSDSVVIQLNGINQFKCSKSYFIDRGVKQPFFLIEELSKEIWNAEKQSYEKVIRMMSHEVNNSVGAANSIIESSITYFTKQKKDSSSDFINALSVARDRIISLNHFTKRLADIVHIPAPVKTNCDLKEILSKILIGFQAEIQEKNILIDLSFKGSSFTVLFDQQQLELVLLNIIKNAIQAISEEGKISFIYNGKPSILVIQNTGEPIHEEIQRKLFEPFFTTKKNGQGLGLTLIREILTNHSCEFSLKTRDDGLTEFKILFSNLQ